MATDPYLRQLQTAQYHAYRALIKNHPQVYEMYKNLYKIVTKDYTNKAMRCVRKENEAEFQALYEVEALKRGIKTNYNRRKAVLDRIKKELALAEASPTKPLTVRLM